VYIEKFHELIPALLAGKGDVIASNLTITEQRKQQVAFTVPVVITKEQLIVRADDKIAEIKDLKSRNVALLKSTSYWDTMQRHKKHYPEINLQQVSDDKSVIDVLDDVANSKHDVTVADSNIINALLPVQPKLKVAFDVSDERPVGWAVRPDSVELKKVLDNFLTRENLLNHQQTIFKGDLAEIKKRKVLRVLTRNNAATYFLWRGELMGFEYELVKKFAKKIGVRLEVIVVPDREALFSWLRKGKGDLVAASITIPDQAEKKSQELSYSRLYNQVREVVVGRSGEQPVSDLAEFAGRTFHVRKSSAYWTSLQKIKQHGVNINIKPVPESEETEEILAKVAEGEYDLTMSDSHILDIDLTWRDDIKELFDTGKKVSHGWVVRHSSQQLLNAVNKYLKQEYRGTFYNITRRKYFEKPKTIAKRLEQRVDSIANGKLSPYDETVQEVSAQYNFDWRLVTAQMFQESRFNPGAKSWAGAKGLMQIMPRTARELGIKDLKDPKLSILAGVKYLDWLRERFEPELSVTDRMWFTLAAYNAGPGHVHDARRLAKEMGWSSTRWFDHVERAMLLLSKRKYARQARHGYVRGIEPVKYVQSIRNRFQAYVKLTNDR
jgi:membrane-bound lytic murein transglycosylase F